MVFYRHVLPDWVKGGKISHDPKDSVSVDLACFSTPKRSRIVWGLMRGKPKKGKQIGDYKDPARWVLFTVSLTALISHRPHFLKAVYRPSNMDGVFVDGRPQNAAHCELEMTATPRTRLLILELFEECADCPDVTTEVDMFRRCIADKATQAA